MRYSFLSIPGLPSAFAGVDSKIYHIYDEVHSLIEDLVGQDVEVFEYVWPVEVDKKELAPFKALRIPAYYLYYNLDAEYRKQVVDLAKERILEALEGEDMLFLMLHSHGNRVAFDALLKISKQKLQKIIVLSFAPAYRNVMRGIVPPGLTEGELKQIESSVHSLLSFRMRKDMLSGDPHVDNCYSFDPKFYEFGFWGHSSIRHREDVMEVLRCELTKRIKKDPS